MYNRFTDSDMLHGSQLHTVAKKKRVQTCNFAEHTVPFFRQYTFNGGTLLTSRSIILLRIDFCSHSARPSITFFFAVSIRLSSLFHFHVRFLPLPLPLMLLLLLFPFLLLLRLIRSCYVSIVSASFVQFHTYKQRCIYEPAHIVYTQYRTTCTWIVNIVNIVNTQFRWLLLLFCSFLCRCMILIEFSIRFVPFKCFWNFVFHVGGGGFSSFLAQGSIHLALTEWNMSNSIFNFNFSYICFCFNLKWTMSWYARFAVDFSAVSFFHTNTNNDIIEWLPLFVFIHVC